MGLICGRVLPLSDPVRLQLVVDQVVLGLALLAAKLANSPVFLGRVNVHVYDVLS
jgi:hypothetical protein